MPTTQPPNRCLPLTWHRRAPLAAAVLIALAALLPMGCRGPSRANIELRKTNQELRRELTRLEARNAQLEAEATRVQSQSLGSTVETLPAERLDQLFTVAGLSFGRLTGPAPVDGRPGLRVYVRPLDAAGDRLKAAGAMVVEAYDLDAQDVRLGRWEFPLEKAKELWVSAGLINEYVLPCPWEGTLPEPGTKATIRVTFVEGLTGRQFEERTDVTLK